MSATPRIPDAGPSLMRENVTARKEPGEAVRHVHATAPQGLEEGRKEEKVQQAEAQKSVTNVNLLDSGLEFSQDQDTGLTVIKMYDRETGQLVRQLPPEETLAFLRRLADDKKGVLVSKKL